MVKNCSVIALCRNKEKAKHIFARWLDQENFHLLIQSVEDKINCKDKIDYIIHAASCSATQLFHSKPVDLMRANIIGCYNLLELAREKQTRGFLFLAAGQYMVIQM